MSIENVNKIVSLDKLERYTNTLKNKLDSKLNVEGDQTLAGSLTTAGDLTIKGNLRV